MRNKILLVIIFHSFSSVSKAQITGSDTVCAGFLYSYQATITGADSFAWSLPAAWAVISGAGTSQVQVLCTQNIGQVCVDGFDTSGNFIAQYCHIVYWGDGGLGWNLSVNPVNLCQCPPMTATVVPNGTGGGCGGCGIGNLSPNISFAIYDNPWPTGTYIGPADGNFQFPIPFNTTTYYVYQVDVTFGINNAILIEGGLCPATVNNNFTINGPCMYVNLPIYTLQSQICIGDTILAYTDNSLGNFGPYGWNILQGNATLLPAGSWDSVLCIVNGPGSIVINMLGFAGPCPFAGQILLNPQLCIQQLTGDSIVCSGYTYSYNASIAGAVTYTWTLPSGWYGLTGQGTSSITATCNINDGDICVQGFDANSNSVGIECITTQWGNSSGGGWDVQPTFAAFCLGDPFAIVVPAIVANGTGTGTCPGGCGNGTQHSNLLYALYDSSVPDKQFMGVVDNVNSVVLPPLPVATYYVYFVDTTLGADFPDAVIISGGCGTATITNEILVAQVGPSIPVFTQVPDPACIGDTVLITQTGLITNSAWSPVSGLTILSHPTPEQALVVLTSSPAVINYEGFSIQASCYSTGAYTVNIISCGPPAASFIATTNPICPGTCTGFTNLSTNATSYQWNFPGANPS